MTVHRVRLLHSTAGKNDYHAWLNTWLTNMTPWSDPEVPNDLPSLRTQIDGSGEWYQTELAFEWTEDRAIILDNLAQYASSYCDWHRIAYHVCTHDEENGGPCSWDEVRENGTIPSYVPTFTVSE
jgi:hypothetical protein